MEQLILFHDHTMVVLAIVTVLVFYFLSSTITNSFLSRFIIEGQEIEIL